MEDAPAEYTQPPTQTVQERVKDITKWFQGLKTPMKIAVGAGAVIGILLILSLLVRFLRILF